MQINRERLTFCSECFIVTWPTLVPRHMAHELIQHPFTSLLFSRLCLLQPPSRCIRVLLRVSPSTQNQIPFIPFKPLQGLAPADIFQSHCPRPPPLPHVPVKSNSHYFPYICYVFLPLYLCKSYLLCLECPNEKIPPKPRFA